MTVKPAWGITLDEYNRRHWLIVEAFRLGKITAAEASAAMAELTSLHIWR